MYYGDNLFENGNASLVISFENKPIPPKANEPDSPTIPGFYPKGNERFPFLEIKVIRNQVYFKTDSISGVRFEFKGVTGKEFDSELNTYVPFIVGVVTRFQDDKPNKRQKITFGHAVIY